MLAVLLVAHPVERANLSGKVHYRAKTCAPKPGEKTGEEQVYAKEQVEERNLLLTMAEGETDGPGRGSIPLVSPLHPSALCLLQTERDSPGK